jgi:hypothetical protein
MFTLRVTAGKHVAQDGKVYKKGQVFKSARDLRKLFRNKFEAVVREEETIEEEAAPVKKKVRVKLGEAVEHELAEEHGLKVFKREKKFFVYEGEGSTPIHDGALARKDIASTIEAWLEG